MFKSLNQNEMLKVNGGFYYVPVYDFYYTSSGLQKVFIKTEQVASNSGTTYIVRRVYVNGVRVH